MAFILDLASSNSVWSGEKYYNEKRVVDWEQTGPETYSGTVQGTELYHIHLDLGHPRRSTCDCPFAAGRRVICKHMVALYFTVIPGSLEAYLNHFQELMDEAEKADEEHKKQRRKELEQYVNSLSKGELRESLLSLLIAQEEREDERRYW